MTKDPRQEVDEELQFHLEQRTRDYIARGMSPEAAREAAAQRFGDTTSVREACTSALTADRASEKRRRFVSVSWLDVKLGLRMFAKQPGLSLVAVIGMAVAIAFGAGFFTLMTAFLDSTVPIEDGDRLVMLSNRYVDGPASSSDDQPGGVGAAAFDLLHWQKEVDSVEEISAFIDGNRNLISEDGRTELVRVADITASGIRLTRVPAHLGRTLLPEDEQPGAPPVMVIAHDVWQRRFNGDTAILGRTVRLGDIVHTIVGVMPEGFAFPIRHEVWVPLRLAELDQKPGAGPPLSIFGRIADGSSLPQARAELTVIGQALAAAFPQSHGTARAEVREYPDALLGIEGPSTELLVRSGQFGASLLLLIVAVNVAVLVYARTATRSGEIAVRTALGASRGRIVTQLFVEALVLSGVSAALGLTMLVVALGILSSFLPDFLPYWLSLDVSAEVIVYVCALAVVAAIVIGVLPALKATGKRVQASLQQFSARGAGMQLGRTWTVLIVVQVAMAVAMLPGAISKTRDGLRVGTAPPADRAATLLKATLSTPQTARTGSEPRLDRQVTALIQRLQDEPEVSAVTVAEHFPGTEPSGMLEPEDASPPIQARVSVVAPNLFEVFGARVLAGRGFTAADAQPSSPSVIVDQEFATRLAPGGNVVGRRIRLSAPEGAGKPNPWFEIVGVVPVFSIYFTPGDAPPAAPSIYKAAAPVASNPATLVVQMRSGDPARYAQKLRDIAASVDPDMAVEQVAAVLDVWNREQRGMRMIALLVLLVNGSVLVLSAAGIHAMMAFTVARRWREIGIRVALGADGRRVLMGIFGRMSAQIGAGVAAGLAMAGLYVWRTPEGSDDSQALILFPVVAAVMFAVGLLAAAGPARRGLRVQPTEALRNE